MPQEPLIDFTELKGTAQGEALEELARQLAIKMGLTAVYTGRGADRGKDLLLTEKHEGPLSQSITKWLVSCKDYAKSGRAVSEKDVGAIIDKLHQHNADGFLLVTTTTPTSGLKELLDSLDKRNGGKFSIAIWDHASLAALLVKPQFEDELKIYLPNSFIRIKSLGAPNLALEEVCAALPSNIANQIRAIVSPHFLPAEVPTGLQIWPHDTASAKIIDRILHYFFRRDFPSAVKVVEGIEYDAFVETLSVLEGTNSEDTREFIVALIQETSNSDIALNAYQFLAEHYEIAPNEQLELAQRFGNEELDLLFGDDIAGYVYDTISGNIESYECWQDLLRLSSNTEFDYVELQNLSMSPKRAAPRIEFSGQLSISVSLHYGSGSDSHKANESFPGRFSGYFDTTGIHLESVTVDTSSFYK